MEDVVIFQRFLPLSEQSPAKLAAHVSAGSRCSLLAVLLEDPARAAAAVFSSTQSFLGDPKVRHRKATFFFSSVFGSLLPPSAEKCLNLWTNRDSNGGRRCEELSLGGADLAPKIKSARSPEAPGFQGKRRVWKHLKGTFRKKDLRKGCFGVGGNSD